MLEELIKRKVVDYIAMDVKPSELNKDRYLQSVKIVLAFPEHEFRVTVVPGLITKENISKIAKVYSGAQRFYLQKFTNNSELLGTKYQKSTLYTTQEMQEIKDQISTKFECCEIRGK